MYCISCKEEKQKSNFSKSQLKKKKSNRKCILCCGGKIKSSLEEQKELFTRLIKWLKSNGSYFPLLDIKHYNERFRGVILNKSVVKNKEILKIPNCCIMTTIKAMKSLAGQELIRSGWKSYCSHTPLALYLLEEKMKFDSYWKPYIDIIPKTYDDFPQFYKDEELKQLKGSFVLEMIRSRNLNLEQEFNEIKRYLPVFSRKITLTDYIWGRIAVVSRVFHIDLDNNESSEGLVPMADMLNHEIEPATTWCFDNKKNSFVISSNRFMKKNNEIFDTYGPKCNSRYLVNYGFTLENNDSNNQAVLFIKPEDILDIENAEDEMQQLFIIRKLKFLNSNSCSIDDSYCEYNFLIHNDEEKKVSRDKYYRFQFGIFPKNIKLCIKNNSLSKILVRSVFGFLRLIFSSLEEHTTVINKYFTKDKTIPEIFSSIDPISIDNEIKVLETLFTYCTNSLSNFYSPVEKDMKEIKTVEKYSNRWNILNLLIGEKKTLLYYKELSENIYSIWSKTKKYHVVSKFLRKNKQFYPYYELYWKKLSV